MMEAVRRQIDQAMRGVRSAFRGVGAVAQLGRQLQLMDGEGLGGEPLKGVELFQHFGFTSGVPAGSQLVVLPLGGRTSHAVVIATENGTFRLVVGGGEAALYNQWGDHVWLKKDGHAVVKASAQVTIDAPAAHFTGLVTGAVDFRAQGISLVGHQHNEQGDFAPVSGPI